MSDPTRPSGYDWRAALLATGLAEEVEPSGLPPPVDLDAVEGRRILRHVRCLGDAYDRVYDAKWVELRASMAATVARFVAHGQAWIATLLATHAETDRAARYAEQAQIAVQGHLPEPERYTATVDGARYVLASEDICAIPGALYYEDDPAIVDGVPIPTPTVAFKQLAKGGDPALQVSAKEPGREGRQVEVRITDGSTGVPARITGDVATFGRLAEEDRPGVLVLRVSGTSYAVLSPQGLEADAAGYVASINAQVPGLVRASAANGRLTLETVATGAGATLSVSDAAFVARPATLLGGAAAFAALGVDTVLALVVDGVRYDVTFPSGTAGLAAYATAINVQAGVGVIAHNLLSGRLRIETRSNGSGASLVIHADSTNTVLTQLGLAHGMSDAGESVGTTAAVRSRLGLVSAPDDDHPAAGEASFTLGVRRGTLFEETYADLDRTSPGYAAALAAIGGRSLLLGRVEVIGVSGAQRPDNTVGWVGLTGTGGGAGAVKSALTRRIARARKLPAVTGNPDLANALKRHAEAYAAAIVPPKFDDVGAPYDGGFIVVSTFPEVDPAKYTVLKCEQKLAALVAEGAVWVALRRYQNPAT